jgi:hypothetical protein
MYKKGMGVVAHPFFVVLTFIFFVSPWREAAGSGLWLTADASRQFETIHHLL